MSNSTDLVLIEQKESILHIQMNRPNKKNALQPIMYDTMREALEKADTDDSIRVVFITGSGDSFSAGNDLKTFIENPASDSAARFIKAISITKTPIVAAVNGLAIGVGVTMLLHCDLVYAIPEAIFNFAFIDLGVVPEAGSSYLIPQLVGQRKAAELMLLGEKFSAETAQSIGLVNDVIDAEELINIAWKKAEKLASKPPKALALTKQLLKRGNETVLAETIEHELKLFAETLQGEEARNIMLAFMTRK